MRPQGEQGSAAPGGPGEKEGPGSPGGSEAPTVAMEKLFISPPTPANEVLRAQAAARVAAVARSLSDTEASLETAAAGRIPRILAEATDRRVWWRSQQRSSTAAANPANSQRQPHAAAADTLAHGTTDPGSSSAGEDVCRLRVRCSRRQQQQTEGSGSKKPGRHKHRRWLHQQLLVAALRRLISTSGDDPADATDLWGAPCHPSCWQLLQKDPVARELYIKRREGTAEAFLGPAAEAAGAVPEGGGTELADPLSQRRNHCLRLMKKQQQQQQQLQQQQWQRQQRRTGGSAVRAASSDGLRHSELLRQTVAVDEQSDTDMEFPSKAAAAAAAATAASAATGSAEAAGSPAASALARELEVQRLLLQQLEGSELQLLPSVQRIKSLRAAFKPMRQITKDVSTLFSLSAALEEAIRGAYSSLSSVKGGLQQLLQQHAAEAASAPEQQKHKPILTCSSSSSSANRGGLPSASSGNSSNNLSSSSSSSSNASSSLRCMRLNKESERVRAEGMSEEPFSDEEAQMLSFVKRLQRQAAAAAAAARTAAVKTEADEREGREWLVLWRLNGFERKVAHALVSLTSDLDSISLCPLDHPGPNSRAACSPQQQQQLLLASKRKGSSKVPKAVVICRKYHAETASLPPVSLAALLVCAATAAL
ncbi:hypothetical protein, conserved [Eimeria tenella]|uniref:Uncharacterized protein n=1 Tax=Eimeria tenella TaxID=5802 RepID=U6L0L1_EIMTE|nr:hypothetical protein, conserved [Eimeria tenella]CDJ42124.1 hypothetical protein, conserved [Eimeria tenella]|eukprot:XP_013232874.1 hypothetical protein, conserved [Eimeria tenella]